MIAFCVLVKVFMVLVEMNTAWVIKISQIHKTFVGPKQVHIKWIMLHFVVVSSTYFFSVHHLHHIIRNKQHFIDKDFSNSLPIYSLSVSFQYLFLRPTWLRISGNKTKSFRQLYSGFGQHDFGLVVFCVTWLEPWWTPSPTWLKYSLGQRNMGPAVLTASACSQAYISLDSFHLNIISAKKTPPGQEQSVRLCCGSSLYSR